MKKERLTSSESNWQHPNRRAAVGVAASRGGMLVGSRPNLKETHPKDKGHLIIVSTTAVEEQKVIGHKASLNFRVDEMMGPHEAAFTAGE